MIEIIAIIILVCIIDFADDYIKEIKRKNDIEERKIYGDDKNERL